MRGRYKHRTSPLDQESRILLVLIPEEKITRSSLGLKNNFSYPYLPYDKDLDLELCIH